ncbi:hypothetical protein [Sphingomonas hylomeconis]|uniref:Uncharacterized protein n=1 Tax=Sphingomonas hylomeconis TaxID=1395958 RepID=A0ABV7SRG8_9SPHN|nr:hypothetical protein [Sphingomonas hylomeconis]
MNRRVLILALLLVAAPASANDELNIVRASEPVDDKVNTVVLRNLPTATIDQLVTVTNPLGNIAVAIRTVSITDVIPTRVKFRMLDLSGTGPVEFVNGNLLGVPLGASGLSLSYGGLGNLGDGVQFFDGASWDYVPRDQGDGYDPNVRAIKVTMSGTRFATGGSFRLRYRVMLK